MRFGSACLRRGLEVYITQLSTKYSIQSIPSTEYLEFRTWNIQKVGGSVVIETDRDGVVGEIQLRSRMPLRLLRQLIHITT
jgi:hypothetical protein